MSEQASRAAKTRSAPTFMTDKGTQLDDSKSDSPLNKQMSPLSGGAFFGVIAFAFILYKSHDIVRALLVGGAVFAVLYWIMWAGQYLERRTKKKPDQAKGND